ncbi:MAG: UvrD-helicase domain-containing protein, partial [Acidobacteriota bacterium]
AQLLRERPVEARVDPAFQELSEQESSRLFQQSFRTWMERSLGESSPGLRRAFARLAWRDSWEDSPPLEQLQFAAKKLLDWRDYTAPWRREAFPREEELRTLLGKAREVADASSRPRRVTDNLYKGLQPVRLMVQSIDRPEVAGSQTDYDLLEAQILKLGRDLRRDTKKGTGEYGGGVTREDLAQSRDQLLVWIDDFRRRADADLAATLRAEMAPLTEEYNDRKQRQGKLDFVDLLILARNLIVGQQPVRAYLQRRFSHLFIDEFQDTDPLQAEILLLLAANDSQETDWRNVTPVPGKLFLVGDPKQSIYKFRRADIALYRQIREDLQARGVGHVSLTQSFRSVPNIQGFVNAAFEQEMTGEGHADYAPLEQSRKATPGQPSVIALPVPKPYRTRLSKDAVNQSLPEAIAAFIAWLVNDSGWTHRPKADAPAEPIRARDIAVLFRRRTQAGKDLTREYARALESRNVEHLLAGSKSFHHREEVEALRAALTAVEWPEDELSVFATLKGSLFAIPDEALFLYKHRHGRLHPFHRPESTTEPEATVTSALAILAELHRARNHRPFAATVNALLEATRAHAGFLLRPGGNQILANVARVADLARSFEMTGGVSFRGFVEELSALADKGEASEAPVLEEDSDGVRLMTVHGAKGLEFPVVILADLTANLCARDPDQYVDGANRLHATRLLRCAPWELLEHEADESMRERAEGVRVAYVAATRARDLLVIPAIGDEPFPVDGWLSPLDKALYPSRDAFRRSEPVEGCPEFGHSSVMNRPPEYGAGPEPSVKPGLIHPQYGLHEVVWWDPYKLHLGDEANYGVRSEHLLKADGGESLAAYQAWREQRASVIHQAANPTVDLFLASQAKEAPPNAAAVEYILVARDEATVRPGGRRFGTLVHAVLRDVALNADQATIQRTAELNGRILGASSDEVTAAAQAVIATLQHPILIQAAGSERCHREYPVTLQLEDNRVLDGVIDLAFLDAGSWVVIDFKTDANIAERRTPYERQLQWYAHALTEITGFPARGVLLGI